MTFSKRSARISLVIALAGAMGVGAYVAPSLHGQTPAPAGGGPPPGGAGGPAPPPRVRRLRRRQSTWTRKWAP
jgi:hypothetical protein